MILHLLDNDKFKNNIIDQFELVYPNCNKYLIGINSEEEYFSSYKNRNNLILAPYDSQEYKKELLNLKEYEAVIIHFLNEPKIKVLKEAPNEANFVWNIWGMDFYSRLSENQYKLYDDQTKKLLIRIHNKNVLNRWMRSNKIYSIYKNIQSYKRIKNLQPIFDKIKYFSTVLPVEAELVKKYLPLKARYVPFNYGFSSKLLNNDENFKINSDRNNIILGNSGAPTNNHIPIIDFLYNYDINNNNRKIITPLSYGSKTYIDEIIKIGNQKFGDKFLPIKNFIKLEDYFNLIKSCSICIMNHYRQQGVGNLVLMLSIGAKVFLSIRNPSFQFFKNLGVTVYSIEEDLPREIRKNFPSLPDDIKNNNKYKILKYFGHEATRERCANYIKTITANKC